jgi:alkylation response protein AidB-like acyl-CoA dehydrogenase
MSESLEAFRLRARDWLGANVPAEPAPHAGPEARCFVLDWQKRQYEGGWAGLTWPEAAGGKDASVLQQIVWFEEYARASAPSTLSPTFVGLNHAGPTLILCGNEAQKAFHLPKILRGEALWCQGFSEPNSGSDLASLRCKGTVDGDFLVVNGQKIWSSWADIGDYQELLIRTDPDSSRHHGLSWVICQMDTPGITVRPIRTIAGPTKFAEVFYDDVRIPLSNVVGGLNNGWKTAMSTLGFERGTAALALQISLGYRVEALIAGCDDPVALATLMDLRADTAALRAMSYQSALRAEAGTLGSEASMIRLYFAELTQRVNRAAIAIYGIAASEVLGEHGLGYEYFEGYSETIAGGTAEIQRNIIAERVLGLPRGAR